MSVYCSLVVMCWEGAGLLALLCVMFSCAFVTFPYGVLGQVWFLFELIPDLRLLSLLHVNNNDAEQPAYLVILLPAHPAFFAHNCVSGMQSFYFCESKDEIVLQTCH